MSPPLRSALFAALRASWGPDTAFDPAAWSPDRPDRGQCAVTALVIQDYLGGQLLRAVTGSVSHYWNMLPGGEEIDLTRSQFARFEPEGTITRPRGYVLSFPGAAARYRVLAARAGLESGPAAAPAWLPTATGTRAAQPSRGGKLPGRKPGDRGRGFKSRQGSSGIPVAQSGRAGEGAALTLRAFPAFGAPATGTIIPVPTIDPRLRPDLERAMPADDVPGGQYRADGNVRLVLFGDGEWHPVAVKAWRTDRHGRDVIDVGWHAEPGTWSGAYLANPEKMREGWTADRNADRNPGCGPGLSGVVQKAHYQRNDCPG